MIEKSWERDRSTVQKEILTYLAGVPRQLQNGGPNIGPDICLKIGNCLSWISSNVESGPPCEQPLTETAISVHALGKQLRQAALEKIDCGPSAESRLDARTENLQASFDALEKMVHRLAARGKK